MRVCLKLHEKLLDFYNKKCRYYNSALGGREKDESETELLLDRVRFSSSPRKIVRVCLDSSFRELGKSLLSPKIKIQQLTR